MGDDPRIVALLVDRFFALFLKGAAGFGTPVALTAPLLVGLGLSSVKALSLALIGHAVGVSFWVVGTPIVPLVEAQMARVKGKNTKPEIKVRRALHAAGLRFRLHAQTLPGKPDIVLSSRRIAIFVHGCFWHRHPDPDCKLARLPKSRLDFWLPKLDANRERDTRNENELRRLGWDVRTIWECELDNKQSLARLVDACVAMPRRGGPMRTEMGNSERHG